jgi:hypothetical protein
MRDISLGFTKDRFPEGRHIVYIYNDDLERKKTLAKFLQTGLINNEKVLYLVNDISTDEMRKELIELGVDIDNKQNDFDLTEGHYTYCPDNYFSGEFMLDLVGKYYDNAINEGYAGARGAGEMSWALEEGRASIPDLLEYEAKLNIILKEHPLTTVCQYDTRKFNGEIIMDMLTVHPMAVVRGQLVKNPYYIEPEVFLDEYKNRQKYQNNNLKT